VTLAIVPAHGIGGRSDLPLPGEVVLQAGGFVVLVSFLAVGLLWQRPKFGVDGSGGGEPWGRALPEIVQRLADSAALRAALRWLALALLVYLLVAAFAGPAQVNVNPVPRALYVLAWVGVVPASLLFGPVWRVLNPLRALHAALAGALRIPVTGVRALPQRLGYWPAAVGLAVFVWLELVPSDRADPAVVGGFLFAYAVLITAAALVFGERWFDRGDPFEVYSTLIAGLAPMGRARRGTVVLRNPLRGLAAVEPAPGLVAVLAVWWGSTVFDGMSGTTFWVNWLSTVHARNAVATAVLLVLCALVGASYRLTTGAMAGALVTTLVPIAVGYSIAHYASLLLTEGPRGLGLLVGVTVTPVHPAPLLIAAIQVTAILVGHVAGVVAAHDRVLALAAAPTVAPRTPAARTPAAPTPAAPTPATAPTDATSAPTVTPVAGSGSAGRHLADQVPLVLIMIVYTMVGLYLLVIA
jgi:hypothetical protein